MGAAEWTGYTNSPTTYSPYSSLQTQSSAITQPPPLPPTSNSSYAYESTTGLSDHHSNFHIPTGIDFIFFFHPNSNF